MQSFKLKILAAIFLILFVSRVLFSQDNSDNIGRIESEFKLTVPDEIEKDVWEFLLNEFDNEGIKKIDSLYSTQVAKEIFYDQYFDNESKTLFQYEAGARYRQRFIKDSLSKELFQLKLPLNDSTGVARQEIKFNPYKNIKKSDRKAMHPFWRYISPKHRDDVNLRLAALGLTGDELTKSVKIHQERNRIYISEENEPLITMTFDKVCSFYFPYPCFTELELEINEVRFTEASQIEKDHLESVNQKIKDKIMVNFPSLQQDQTPKYNKMHLLLKDNLLDKIYSNLMYIVFGFIMAYALFLMLRMSPKYVLARNKKGA